jgi:hypothetical protein
VTTPVFANVIRLLRDPRVQFLAVLTLYLALLLPTLTRQGISWDEQVDLDIARVYFGQPWGWLLGSDLDPSQTRLPMMIGALVFAALGRDDLITARAVSAAAGLVTLLGVYYFCIRRLNHRVGIVATLILASSPFFLSFARVAFTETDIYVACAIVWLIVGAAWAQDRPTVGRAAVVGLLLGLAVSAKFTAAAVTPVIWLAVMCSKGRRRRSSREAATATGVLTTAAAGLALVGIARILVHAVAPARTGSMLPLLLLLVISASGWLLILLWAAWRRHRTANPLFLAFFASTVAALTFLLVPPVHLSNPAIIDSIFLRLDTEVEASAATVVGAISLHVLSILFKSGPVVGAWLLIGAATAAWQWKRAELQLPLLVCILYAGAVALLPAAQTFYVVPLLPVLAIFGADLFVRLLARSRAAASALAVLAALLWTLDVSLCYPDYNLNGYQWLGVRELAGRPSVGYRSVVHAPSDGVQQAFLWLNENAAAGTTVRAYLRERHIVAATAPAPAFQIAFADEGDLTPAPDYIVFGINSLIPQGTSYHGPPVIRPPFSVTWLQENYRQVFRVERRFDIGVIAVWRRIDS